jgi:hypothetical protein
MTWLPCTCEPMVNYTDEACPRHGERQQFGQWPDEEWPENAQPEEPFDGPDPD